MASKLAFQLTDAGVPGHFAIRLIDKRQVAALAEAEGCQRPIALEPVVIYYDRGNGELAPVDGYTDATARGRIALKVLCSVYVEALELITRAAADGEQIPN